MAGFNPPAGQAYVTPVTFYDKTPQFRSGISTTPPAVTTPAIPATREVTGRRRPRRTGGRPLSAGPG